MRFFNAILKSYIFLGLICFQATFAMECGDQGDDRAPSFSFESLSRLQSFTAQQGMVAAPEDFPAQQTFTPMPVLTPRELLEKIGMAKPESCSDCDAIHRQHNRPNLSCLLCTAKHDFMKSYFAWLYDGAGVGYLPVLTSGFVENFSKHLNVGVIVSLWASSTNLEAKRQEWKRGIEIQTAQQRADGKITQEQMLKIQGKINEEEKKRQGVIQERRGLESQNIVPLRLLQGAALDVMLIQGFVDLVSSAHHQGKAVVIADDIAGNVTVTLFACWLISQGWPMESAIAQACHKRLEGNCLDEHHKSLIAAYNDSISQKRVAQAQSSVEPSREQQ